MKSTYSSGEREQMAKKSTLYRFFRPLDANWETQPSPYRGADPLTSFNPADGSFPTMNNTYADHKN
jgi:hypothetical protein